MDESVADSVTDDASNTNDTVYVDNEETMKIDDVTVCFSVEELDSLEDREKGQHNNQNTKNHQSPNLVGYLYVKPETVPRIHRGEELCVKSDLYTHKRKKRANCSLDELIYRNKLKTPESPDLTIGDDQFLQKPDRGENITSARVNKKHAIWKSLSTKMKFTSEREGPLYKKCIPSGKDESQKNTQERSYKCNDCGDYFSEHSFFLVHQTSHIGQKLNPIIKRSITKHIIYGSKPGTERRIQTEAKSYTCKECGKSFTQNASLIVHKRTHTGERPHKCKVCGKSFISGSYLVMHQRVHTGERPYVCNECGKRFISSSNLIIHKRVHTGEKPYLCTECGKCFGHSSHLVRHQKVHTGERPFTCAECGKSFSRRSHLVRHQTIHTRSPPNKVV
ncbi:zinc finger protein 239-like [Bombina bombina]|uniref:zinc finger protein 239-like n=1 Tax=Bombina bombina TaxID=8345 RepID=UPI00235A64BC|nr:zinc finger protein 239-like [Bombina bombina]